MEELDELPQLRAAMTRPAGARPDGLEVQPDGGEKKDDGGKKEAKKKKKEKK